MSTVSFSLKGFIGYGALADNHRFDIAPLGELSAYARTFSKDRELYAIPTGSNPATTADLTVFSARRDTGVQVGTPLPLSNFLLQVSTWAYRQALLGTFTNNPESFRQACLTEFNGRIIDLTVGSMVYNGTIYLPGVITFAVNIENIAGAWGDAEAYMGSPRLKLWFSDERFRKEYDEYEFEFVAPLVPMDQFFQQSAQVNELLSAVTFTDMTERANDKAGTTPYTRLRTEMFHYYDPVDPTYKIPTYWSILIWGAAGDNIDAIKENLIQWILANSTHTREEWAIRFPDIFTSTEFVVAPFWSQYAVENMSVQAGVYSPVVSLSQALAIALSVSTGTGYTPAHIEQSVQVTSIPFKSIALGVIGGPENRQGKNRLTDHYPDYMNVSSTHPDFGRMSLETQGLVLMLEDMLRTAEVMTEFSDVPTGMTRMSRTNRTGAQILYLVKSYRDVQYLVVTANTMHVLFPPTTYAPLELTTGGAVGLTALPHATGGTPYRTTLIATGGTGIYTYSLPDAPYGVLLAHAIDPVTGEYSATTDEVGGDAVVRVRVTDSSMDSRTIDFTLHVIAATP